MAEVQQHARGFARVAGMNLVQVCDSRAWTQMGSKKSMEVGKDIRHAPPSSPTQKVTSAQVVSRYHRQTAAACQPQGHGTHPAATAAVGSVRPNTDLFLSTQHPHMIEKEAGLF